MDTNKQPKMKEKKEENFSKLITATEILSTE